MKKERPAKPASPPGASVPKLRDWHAAAVIIAAVAFFFRDIILQKAFFWEDFTYFFYPVRNFAAVSIAQGQMPLWNPYTMCGMPFQADIQSAIFYLPNLLLSLFVSGGRLSFYWLEMEIVVHYMIAGICMYYLVRSFGLERVSALFSGLVFSLSGFMISHAIHQVVICQVAWFPLIVLLFRRSLEERSVLWMIVCGLVLGHAVLAGYPQVSLYIYLFLLLFFLMEAVSAARKEGIGKALPQAGLAAGIVIISLLVAAVQLLPTMELAPLTQRSGITYEKSLDGSLSWGGLITLLFPKFFGATGAQGSDAWLGGSYGQYWETCIYIGIIPLIAVVFAGTLLRKNRYVAFLFAVAVFSLLYALGDSFVLHKLFYTFVPGFDKFREPGRLSLLWTFAAALLSGFGLQQMMELLAAGRKSAVKLLSAVALLGAAAWFAVQQGFLQSVTDQRLALQVHAIASAAANTGLLLILAGCCVLYLRSRRTLPAGAALLLLFAVQIADIQIFGFSQNNGSVNPEEYFDRPANIVNFMKEEGKNELFRVNARLGGAMILDRNQGMVDRLFLLEGYSALVFHRLYPPCKDRRHINDLLNVKYYVEVDDQQRTMSLGRSTTYLPRAFVVFHDTVIADEAAISSYMQSDGFDAARTVVLEKPGPWQLEDTLSYRSAAASITSYDPGAISLDVSTPKDGYLVLSEAYYPGWKAWVDGREETIQRADWSERALPVARGEHHITFRFEPASFRRGWMISLLTLALCGGGIVYFRRTQRRAAG